ncbi:MAG: AAA family ATPase [Candidatus Babeliales bacterium]|nr:AAA family ATPase [Candidatus Babeliales bacterium]
MNLENFTTAAQELINKAIQIAQSYKSPVFNPIHTLKAGLEDSFCLSFFNNLKLDTKTLITLINTELEKMPKIEGGQIGMDNAMQEFFNDLKKIADNLGDSYISLEAFILGWATTKHLPEKIKDFFKSQGFTKDKISEQIKVMRKGKTVKEKGAESKYEILERFTRDFTKLAAQGKLDPVIGRDQEIRRVIQILSRRTKNNPVLIGDPGVGKTAIVEGIAQRIVNKDVPENLQNSKILSLDLGLLIAGAKYQGEFEDRLKGVLKEIEDSQETLILFIDELHMLVGAGATGGGMDASNLLKPALARGDFHCIGATTLAEYKKYIEKDAALERRFQKVLVEEPTIEDTISILRGLKEKYELHHGIRIKDQALVAAAKLAARHITDRFLPDKAIDLVDEAASMVKMAISSRPEEIDQLERKINQLEIEKLALNKEKSIETNSTKEATIKRLADLEKELANLKEKYQIYLNQWKTAKAPLEKINKLKEQIEQANIKYQLAERDGDFAKASEIKYGTLVKLENEIAREQEKLKSVDNQHLVKDVVDEQDIAIVLSRWTKIPVDKLTESEKEKILHMDEILKKRVIGQDEAIEKITEAIQAHRAGLTDPNKPIGSFLFLGPTGVGKTEVAKTLADFLFDDPNHLIRIDMSEYMEKHSVARLIGSPPGYVGHEEGGQLTEAVRRNPYSVVLFDEIEKAHPDVFNIFLQILDEGHLTDGQGRKVSFKNCILIMTSNIGSQIILEAGKLTDKVKNQIEDILHKTFRPEFLNRIDQIVFFKMLNENDVERITQIHINALKNKLERERNIELNISNEVIGYIAELGYEKEFGARPLKRAIQQYIIVPLSKYLIQNGDVKKIDLVLKDKKITVT